MKCLLLLIIMLTVLVGCSSGRNSGNRVQEAAVEVGKEQERLVADFDPDSAYAFVVAQCDFGPRVPGSEAHRLCGDYLVARLKQYGAAVVEQNMKLTTFDGTKIDARNIIGEYNPYLLGLGTMLGMLLISFSFFFIVTHGKSKGLLIDISDGELVFKTPFNKRYWSLANKEMSNVKNLCSIALLFAIMFLCKAITIPSGFGALGLGLTYLVFSVIAMIYGPICGMTIGILSDVLGHFIYPSGAPFFIGYTINSLLSGLIYGLCFYRTKVTFAKCLYARVFVNLFVNIFLGSIWWAIVYNLNFDGFVAYVMLISIPKNLVYLLPQAILLFLFLKICAKPIGAFGLIDERIAENVSII